MNRTDIINYLIRKNSYRHYLEIGVRNPDDNFNSIVIDFKDGVDPAGNCNYPITSDLFFNNLSISKKYDIIFIDGLHLDYQVERDISNSLLHLNENGVIIMHDCNPLLEEHQIPDYLQGKTWNVTTWKAFAKFRMTHINLFMCVVDTDYGLGIIKRGTQTLFTNDAILDFNFLARNRCNLLNLISIDDFKVAF